MVFDRNKFKATKVSVLKEQASQMNKSNRANEDGRVPFHTITEGTTKWRIFPAHPDQASFMVPKQVHWLPQEVSYKKDGKDVTEIKRRPVFNSKTHAGVSKDIVEEYINFVTKMVFDEVQDPELRKQKLFKLTDWRSGLRGRTTWIVYAAKVEGSAMTLGRLELPGLVKDKMNELSIQDDTSDSVIQTDPFTDPDSGKALLIIYDKSQKEPVKKYSASLEWRGDYKLTDQQLEEFINVDSLDKVYKNSYKRKDFEKALAGLKIFDEDSEYNVFAHDSWLDICEEMDKMFPDESDTSIPPTTIESKPKVEEVKRDLPPDFYSDEDEDEEDIPAPSSLNLEEMSRDDLKHYIKDKGLRIRVLKKYTDQDIVDLIVREEALLNEEDDEEEMETTAPNDRLQAMRAKMQNS